MIVTIEASFSGSKRGLLVQLLDFAIELHRGRHGASVASDPPRGATPPNWVEGYADRVWRRRRRPSGRSWSRYGGGSSACGGSAPRVEGAGGHRSSARRNTGDPRGLPPAGGGRDCESRAADEQSR